MKNYSIIVFWVLIYAGSIGFLLPYLFSEKSNWTVALGIILVILLIYGLVVAIKNNKFKKQ